MTDFRIKLHCHFQDGLWRAEGGRAPRLHGVRRRRGTGSLCHEFKVRQRTVKREGLRLNVTYLRSFSHTVIQGLQWLDQTADKTVRAPDQTARFGTP